MISYHICPTALGYAAILFQTRPFLVKRILLPRSHKSALTEEIQRIGPAKPGRSVAVLDMCKDMKAYFKGTPIETPWKFLDLGGLTPLQRSVLGAVASVPRGHVRSYGHRIVRADGSLGGFGGGAKLKKCMLSLEKQKA
jgi:methylated-DNA-[protein]-cysteine S-methyltransferase